MTSYLQSEDVRSRFCTWSTGDLPQIDDCHKTNVTKIKQTYTRCIEERFQTFLQNWENREKHFKKAYDDLDERFHRGFFDFEKDIRAIDRVLIGDSGDEFKSFEIRPGRLFSPLDTRMKKFLVVTGAIFMPVVFSVGLAAGFLSAPVFGFKVIEKHLKERTTD
ncbi:hypothetical protein OS493_010418 [Desmophyllum pertusum]|uniref:Uncharacterized protein n=1 Tax=Desmophyllum pertusum TaxID=174260 RepID=A0A9X0A3H7_9CNID|nr:hypothetical protein OS493_010418 [Desmophyllum pertusum]